MAHYQKPTNGWCEVPLIDKKKTKELGKTTWLKPVGFCEFCDKNNETWYIPQLKCHHKHETNT